MLIRLFRRAMSMTSEADVLFDTLGRAGVITLNRPKVLNSLNLSMAQKIYPQLKQWENDDSIDFVIIEGSGEKAFCAGGDVVAVSQDTSLARDFFRAEYTLNHLIGTLRKPYIALIHGITMGGGVGLSVHGKYRVSSEKTLFAMPETAIGLFPDVGGGYFMPRLRGQLGAFLALSGHRLKGADVWHAGVSTHHVPLAKLSDLKSALVKSTNLAQTLDEFHTKPSESFTLAPHLDTIDAWFASDSVEDIMERLSSCGGELAPKLAKSMAKMSPTSMKISLRQLREGAKMSSLADVLRMEYRMAWSCAREGSDFREGVRALLIDKDNSPKWNPPTLADVSDSCVDSFFCPLADDNELRLPQRPTPRL